MNEMQIETHEKLHIGMLLAFVGGFIDAYTYIFRGGVFANAQTGNVVLMGVYSFSGNWQRAFLYLVPIVAFSLGVIMSEFLRRKKVLFDSIPWRRMVLLVEAFIFALVAFIPSGVPNLLVNAIVSFVAAMQMNSFRRVLNLPYTTTICTGNLRSSMELLSRFIFDKDKKEIKKFGSYMSVILCFALGAGFGSLLTREFGGITILLCSVLLLFTIFLVHHLQTIEHNIE